LPTSEKSRSWSSIGARPRQIAWQPLGLRVERQKPLTR